MQRLIFDIETVGEDFETLDPMTKEVLTGWIKKEAADERDYDRELTELKEGLGFSALTGQIVALGVLDDERNEGAVYYQNGIQDKTELNEAGVKYKPSTEAEMLTKFWELAGGYSEFVSFNGRSFDVPFMMVRSAVHGIRPGKDLMSNRYLSSQKFSATHIDLYDQLTFYGAVRRKGGLHMWTRAFGIQSPKAGGTTGQDVARLYREEKYLEIARYNAKDLSATRELFHVWQKYLRF